MTEMLYKVEYDKKNHVYTAFCPVMKPVRFSDKNKKVAEELAEEGIRLYLKTHANFLKGFNKVEV